MNRGEGESHHLDLGRVDRTNVPEVVFAKFKDDNSLIKAIDGLLEVNGKVLVTKCSNEQLGLLRKKYGKQLRKSDEISGTAIVSKKTLKRPSEPQGSVMVISAGTSDHFVAEEAAISAEFLGLKVYRHYDCGVAGIHRIEGALKILKTQEIDTTIVVAGMEGALPSIISGLVKQPMIAVPTSVGYGVSFNGVAALLSMLNSCSPGISVVNIDNGFGAAACAYKMIKWMREKHD